MTTSQSPQIPARRASLALDRPRQSTPRHPPSWQPIVRQPTACDASSAVAIDQPSSSPRRTTPCIGSVNAPRHEPRSTQIPIASDAPPRHTSRGFLVWGFFCQGVSPERQIFCPSSVSLFDLKARFFGPDPSSLTSSRAGAVKVGRRANLAACSELARPYLDSFEHDDTLGAIGMTIRGEPAFGRGSVAPQPCIRWVQGPEP